jgi:hypothetical protein
MGKGPSSEGRRDKPSTLPQKSSPNPRFLPADEPDVTGRGRTMALWDVSQERARSKTPINAVAYPAVRSSARVTPLGLFGNSRMHAARLLSGFSIITPLPEGFPS